MKFASCAIVIVLFHWLCILPQNDAIPAPLPEVILAGEQPFAGQLIAINNDTFRFSTADGEPRDPLTATFIRWSHPRDPVRRPRILLNDGSELVADLSWTTDGSVQITGDEMQVRTSLLGRVSFPRGVTRGILFDAARDPVVELRVMHEMRTAELKEDQVWLVNGDRLTGQVTSIDGAVATLKLADQSIDVPLTNLSAVAFHKTEIPASAARWAIGLQDGTLLRATEVGGDEMSLRVELASGVEVKGKSLKEVVFLQNLAGSFVYLSDLEPIDYKHTPYFDVPWPLAVDENLQGQPLRAGNRRYLKGVAMHSASRAAYRLTGNEKQFEATIALDDTADNEGSAIFRVYAVRDGKPELAFESEIIRGGDAPQPISVDIAGAQGMVLLVDYADYGDQQDHANWLDARLVQ